MIQFYYYKFSKKNDLDFPFTYEKLLSKYQFYNSFQILMMVNNNFAGLARLHYININTFELGDFFISKNFRGKKYKGVKYYQYLINELLKYSKKINKHVKNITLAVDKENIPAIKVYEKNNFIEFKNKKSLLKSTKKIKYQYMILNL